MYVCAMRVVCCPLVRFLITNFLISTLSWQCLRMTRKSCFSECCISLYLALLYWSWTIQLRRSFVGHIISLRLFRFLYFDMISLHLIRAIFMSLGRLFGWLSHFHGTGTSARAKSRSSRAARIKSAKINRARVCVYVCPLSEYLAQ